MRTRDIRRTGRWCVLAQSVRGALHRRRDQPNQDAIDWFPVTRTGPPLIVAVSDGHGSAKSFRSSRGSQIAVAVAMEEAKRLLGELHSGADEVRKHAESHLPRALADAWQDRVRQDMKAEPFTAKERRAFTALYGAPAWKALRKAPLLSYGATLLLAIATPTYLLLAQIGDGDIVVVDGSGCATRPLAGDPRLFAGETTSLCLPDAADCFTIGVRPMSADPPALVLLTTDGYANSYEEDAGFMRVGPDLLAILKEEPAASVRRDLARWLDEVSAEGSGDDVTLGALCLL